LCAYRSEGSYGSKGIRVRVRIRGSMTYFIVYDTNAVTDKEREKADKNKIETKRVTLTERITKTETDADK
jgi:hypothetical protein